VPSKDQENQEEMIFPPLPPPSANIPPTQSILSSKNSIIGMEQVLLCVISVADLLLQKTPLADFGLAVPIG
jgi:hypothetical protein